MADGFDGAAHRVGIQMGVAVRRGWVGVTEKFSDDRQPERGTGPKGRKAMTQIVEPKAFQTRRLGNRAPRLLEVYAGCAVPLAGD